MAVIYCAGALRGSGAIDYIQNMHKMIRWGIAVMKCGHAPVVPCLDILVALVGGSFGFNDLFNVSAAILRKCDKMIILPGWEASEGVKEEIRIWETECKRPMLYAKTHEELANFLKER